MHCEEKGGAFFIMTKKVKFIVGANLCDLENQLNEHLRDIDADSTITYDFEKYIAVIETKQICPTRLCCECQHWDDKGDHQALLGECPIKKKRVRYNDGACGQFKQF